jgi:predicted ATPase with chaperone activity
MSTDTAELAGGLLSALLSEEAFHPPVPRSLADTGLNSTLVESLVIKYLATVGTASGRTIAENVCLPFGILESLFQALRTRQIIVHTGSAPLNDYFYTLTEQGRERAAAASKSCAYVGSAPVPLTDYVTSVDAQTIRAEAPKRDQLAQAFSDISVDPNLFEDLGPAVNSGAGLFLYGAAGNGKSTLAKRITQCFGQRVWIPHTVVEDGQLIKVYDAAYHEAVPADKNALVKAGEHDRRWVKIRRPTVVVGGELTMDNLEIRHDPFANVSEAPLQMKSNCGCLLIDDFGRQRIEPAELLNRWIVPLENRHDFLTLATGRKIQVPFEQLIIFSTNLEPSDLVDEAFLRRIRHKIEIFDPTFEEFREIFRRECANRNIPFDNDALGYLLHEYYIKPGNPLRACHPRDLLDEIVDISRYRGTAPMLTKELIQRACKAYFVEL